MKVQLLVSEWCKPCEAAEQVWRAVADARAIEFEVLDVAQPEGRKVVASTGCRTIPAIIIDGTLKGVGVQSQELATAMVADAPRRPRTDVQYVGMLLDTASRTAIVAAVTYLTIAGALALLGASLGERDQAWRVASIHAFTLGFVVFMIYGLGGHLLPRFTGNPIRHGAWQWAQQGSAHAGVIGYVVGAMLSREWLSLVGAALAWIALLLFTARILPVLWPTSWPRE